MECSVLNFENTERALQRDLLLLSLLPVSNLSLLLPSVAIIGDELALAWSDGVEQYISLRVVREACPCAHCCGEPDVLGQKPVIEKKLKPESFILKKYEFVGGYGIQFFWADGHSSGIYSMEYLKRLLTL